MRAKLTVWPDWAIYCTLGNFSKPEATIILPKLPTFLGNFCKDVKILHVSSGIILEQLSLTFGNFLLVTLPSSHVVVVVSLTMIRVLRWTVLAPRHTSSFSSFPSYLVCFWKVISTVLDTRMEEGWDVGNLTVMVLEWIGVIAPFHFGSGCSSVGRAVPSEISDQRFETCDRQFYFQTNCIVRSIEKTKILFFN